MSKIENLTAAIHNANIEVHQIEARYYELIHAEIYSKYEQHRIDSMLKSIGRLITANQKRALDFGAGTGNITGKLLGMGYEVTAIDISAEMCQILKNKYKPYLNHEKLRIINSPIEDVSFDNDGFDLVTCYSILHHLPDYAYVIQRLSAYLKKGGVMYLDHEDSFLLDKSNIKEHAIKLIYSKSSYLLNKLYFKTNKTPLPHIDYHDYEQSDYWDSEKHHIDHKKIKNVFEIENFEFFIQINYHLTRTWLLNPFFYMYRYLCKPDMCLWVARK